MNNAAAFESKRVLITGGLGFIGSNLAIRLAEAGAQVTIIDSSVPGCGANPFNLAPAASRVEVIDKDIGDTPALESKLRETGLIFNLAGEVSHLRSVEDPERDLYLNAIAQLRFLQACRRCCPGARVVYAGTRQIYGKPQYSPVDEHHPVQPTDFNGVHKCAAMQYHLLFARRGDLDCVVLNLSNVYGPRMALHLPQQGFLGGYLRRALHGEPLVYYGDGSQLRDPVYVDDAVDAFLRAGAAPELRDRSFNLGGPEVYSIRQIAEIVASESGAGVQQAPFPEHLARIDIGSYVSDASRIRRELGWVPRIGFREGVRLSLAYYRAHKHRYLGLPGQPAACTAAGPTLHPAWLR
jgi:nucleoside-diphosphate-sugar epimerase